MRKLDIPEFRLSTKLTEEQLAFFKTTGALIFKKYIDIETVNTLIKEVHRIEKELIDDGVDKIHGIPLKYGKDEQGNPTIQRICFLSKFSYILHEMLEDPRLIALLELVKPYQGRIGEYEKDGLVLNNYIRTSNSAFSQMGWHTDSPRDLFMGQRIMPMLNVGIHLDTVPFENGGLRILPGTHTQGMLRLLFKKKYFIDHKPDPKEVGFDIEAGDLTVHDGRLWHRVQQSSLVGEASRRRVMYIPIVTGKYKPKDDESKTPFYHRLASTVQN